MLKGYGGAVNLNLGDGMTAVGEVEKWNLDLGRAVIPNTTLDLESETFIKGKKSHSGVMNYFIRLYTDANRISAEQLIPLILDDEASGIDVQAEFRLGNHPADTAHWMRDVTTVSTTTPQLAGAIILEQTAIDVSADNLILCRSTFRVNGELTWSLV